MRLVRPVLDAAIVGSIQDALYRRHSRYGLLWRLGVASGLRISDLLRLQPKRIRRGKVSVKELKTGKRRTIIFDRPTLSAIQQHINRHRLLPDDFLFYRSALRRDVPMSRQWARKVIAREASQFGLSGIGAHSMRKIYACNMYRATGSIEAVRAALNHSRAETTLIYLKDVLAQSGAS